MPLRAARRSISQNYEEHGNLGLLLGGATLDSVPRASGGQQGLMVLELRGQLTAYKQITQPDRMKVNGFSIQLGTLIKNSEMNVRKAEGRNS